jgi:HJR/Mrr/RecB family endonuclease
MKIIPADVSEDEHSEFEAEEQEMPWESAAKEAVADEIRDLEFDEVRGVVYLHVEDHKLNRVKEGFTSFEEIKKHLADIAEEQWYANVPFEDGEALFGLDGGDMADGALAESEVEEFFDGMAAPEEANEEIVNAKELLLPQSGLILRVDAEEISEELIKHLAKHPELMHKLNSRKFEYLVAELFKDKGYDVELTKRTRDGGFDVRAIYRSDIGALLTLIECKKYAPENKIGVEFVRGLYGVVTSEGATKGLIATTSTFSRDAKALQKKHEFRLELADMHSLRKWLSEYGRRKQ